MVAGRLRYSFIVFVISLCVIISSAVRSEAKRKILETLIGEGLPTKFQFVDEPTAEQMLISCRKEIASSEAVKSFDSYLEHATTEIAEVNLQKKIELHDVISDLSPLLKQNFLDCLRREILPKENTVDLRIWYSKCLEYVFGCPVVGQDPSQEQEQSNSEKSSELWLSRRLGDSDSSDDKSKKKDKDSSKSKKSKKKSSKKDDEEGQKEIIMASALTALSVVLFSCVCCLCCCNGDGSKVSPRDDSGYRDDGPLLNVCSSDLSAGSTEMSNCVGKSGSKNFRRGASGIDLTTGGGHHDGNSRPSNYIGGTSSGSLLPLPPGRKPPLPTSMSTAKTAAAAAAGEAPESPPVDPQPMPPPPPVPKGPPPPPPPKGGRAPPPMPPKPGNLPKPPSGPHHRGHSSSGGSGDFSGDPDSQKAKLKPFFWDKVMADPDHTMVWHELKAGSFQVNEEMMESLFGYAPVDKAKINRRKESSSEPVPQYIKIIDPKKAQNLSILLKALNVTTEEVCDALNEGNELPTELVHTLLKMAPTAEEELKLRLFSGELCQLGPAERFLKVVVDIPYAFKRMETLFFMSSVLEDMTLMKESFATLEVACTELKKSRLFLKLLEAVLKTGNRMNDGTFRGGAQAFKLDTLLKLSDVKGIDGKTTLLLFVVQEISRSEGVRAAKTARQQSMSSTTKTEDLKDETTPETKEYYRSLGLQVVSSLSTDLINVRKAAVIDGDNIGSTVSKLSQSLLKTKQFLQNEMASLPGESDFRNTVENFVQHTETEIKLIEQEEKRIMAMVKSTGDYFHGDTGKDEGLRLFVVVRDFLIILDKVCKEVKAKTVVAAKQQVPKKSTLSVSASQESRHSNMSEVRERLFPQIKDRRMEGSSSSDDESKSSMSP
ncbi:formin-like protein 3 [Impatiens glandulifera]|uniref:formin-like protein 3 n=1 Tax=Impatiens glandulifera TaxID=253017 RepID=UPI001FB0F5CA|nr:formin-like protein 3 [Impatiens glandulifera]